MSKYLYNGVELPEIPEWNKETYPYVVLQATGDENAPYVVYCCRLQPTVTSGESVLVAKAFKQAEYRKYNAYMGWKYLAETTVATTSTITGVFWSNTDIYYDSSYSDDETLAGTLYLSASEPVLVEGGGDNDDGGGEIVETDFMLYNGVKLPKLPAWDIKTYKYALIAGPYTVADYPDAYYYHFTAVNLPMEYSVSNGRASVIDNPVDWQASLLASTEELAEYLNASGDVLGTAGVNEWGELTDQSLLGLMAYPPILWANYYILNTDETVYLAPSEPVPVPEEPETVLSWQKHDAYKPNTEWDGQTFYKVIGNKWVKHDAYDPQGGTS